MEKIMKYQQIFILQQVKITKIFCVAKQRYYLTKKLVIYFSNHTYFLFDVNFDAEDFLSCIFRLIQNIL